MLKSVFTLPHDPHKLRSGLRMALVLLVYLVLFIFLDKLTLGFQTLPGVVAWYPPDGLTFALLLVFGARFVPVVALASLVSSFFIYHFSMPSVELLGWALFLSLSYGLAAEFLRRRHIDWRLRHTRDLLWLILTTGLVSALLAAVAISASIANGDIPASARFSSMFQWWIGEVSGVVTLTPFLLIHVMSWVIRFTKTGFHIPKTVGQPAILKVSAQAFTLLVSVCLVLYVHWPFDFQPLFLVVPPMVWIAFEFGLAGVSFTILTVNFAVILAFWKMHPFDFVQLGALQLQWLIIGIAGLLNGSIITEYRRSEFVSNRDATPEIQRRQNKVIYELSIILVTALAVWLLEYIFDFYEMVTRLEARLGFKGLDETLVMVVFLGFALAFFSYRRWREVRVEILQRQKAEAELNSLNHQLEARVAERTADLSMANLTLQAEIAERKQAEQAFKHSEERFRAMVENNADAIALVAADGAVIYDSPSAPGMLGYGPDEWIGHSVFELVHPDDLSETLGAFQGVAEIPKGRNQATFRVQHKDGTWRWIEAVATNLLAEPSVEAVVVNYRDITWRKQAEEALLLSEDRYRDLVENSHDLICTHDLEGRLLSVNPHAEQSLGYPSGTLLNQNIYDFLTPDTQPYFADYLSKIKEDGIAEGNMIVYTRQGEKRIWEFRNTLRTEGVSEPIVRGMARDVTEQRKSEEALRESEQHFRGLFENTPISIWEEDFTDVQAYLAGLKDKLDADPEGYLAAHPEVVGNCAALVKVADVNRASLELHGAKDKADLIGNIDKTFTPQSYVAFQQELVALLKGETRMSLDAGVQTLDGLQRFVTINWSVLPGHEDNFSRVLVSLTDITERKQAEEELTNRTNDLSELYGLSRALASADDLDEILILVNRSALDSIGVSISRIALLEMGHLVVRAVHPVGTMGNDAMIGERAALGTLPYIRKILDRDEPVVLEAANPEINDHERSFLRLDSVQTMVLAPLRIGRPGPDAQHIQGLLMLGERRNQEREPFTPGKLRLAQSIGNQAAVAIQRMLLRQQTERRLQQLAALRDIDQTIASSFDLRLSAGVLLSHIIEQLEVDATALWVFDPSTRLLEYKAGRGFRSDVFEHAGPLRLGEGYVGRAALEVRTIHIADLMVQRDNPRLLKALEKEVFVSYYGVPLVAKGNITGVLEVFHRTPLELDDDRLYFLLTLAGQAAIAVDNVMLFDNLQRANKDLFLAYDKTLEGWSAALDLRDEETEGHTQRVTDMTVRLAREMGFVEPELTHIRRGALLHDIGKMGIPDRILLKHGELSEEEWEIMRKHPVYAYNLISPIAYLRPALDIPYCHHEKWDGSGYPRGLKGNEIPLAARIFSIVDVWDALSSDRPYRSAWPRQKVLDHLKEQSGSHFDPQVVEAFSSLIGGVDDGQWTTDDGQLFN